MRGQGRALLSYLNTDDKVVSGPYIYDFWGFDTLRRIKQLRLFVCICIFISIQRYFCILIILGNFPIDNRHCEM